MFGKVISSQKESVATDQSHKRASALECVYRRLMLHVGAVDGTHLEDDVVDAKTTITSDRTARKDVGDANRVIRIRIAIAAATDGEAESGLAGVE